MTSQDIINSALRKIGALATGETATTDESNDGLVTLNDIVDSWNAQSLMIFTVQSSDFPLTPAQQTYTLGTGGNFNIPRPPRINQASILLPGTTATIELPMEYLTDFEEWQRVPVKSISSVFPIAVYDDESFPLRNLSFWPVPSTNYSARLYFWNQLSSFADLVTNYTFPPGYARALRYNLAMDLAPEYGRTPIDPALVALATQALAVVKSHNSARMGVMVVDPAIQSRKGVTYNWITGTNDRP